MVDNFQLEQSWTAAVAQHSIRVAEGVSKALKLIQTQIRQYPPWAKDIKHLARVCRPMMIVVRTRNCEMQLFFVEAWKSSSKSVL